MSILTALQKELLRGISESPLGEHYVWTGGTALAYRLKHRYSTDLDFFTQTLQAPEVFLSWIHDFQNQHKLTQKRYEEKLNRQLFIFSRGQEDIQLEFVYFPFQPLKNPRKDPTLVVRVDGISEIAVNKILSAFQRREPKDAYDLYLLCTKRKLSLKSLTKKAEVKFGTPIDYASLLSKLVASSQSIDRLKPLLLKEDKNLSQRMQDFFQAKGNRYLRMMML